jgi:hypothetical protein
MKLLFVLAAIGVMGLFFSCEKNDFDNSASLKFDTSASLKITVNTCKNPVISGNRVSICFDSLLTDSRCPTDGICVWRGFAAGKFSFSVNDVVYRFPLSEFAMPGLFRKDTILAGYKIEFIDLEPYPGTVLQPAPADKIKAEINITKL